MQETQFNGQLDRPTMDRVNHCNSLLTDPGRLAALARTGLMGSSRDVAFDRLAHLAALVLKVPLTIVSLVSDEKQFFKAGHGLPEYYDQVREIPIDDSICRYTLAGEPIIAADASADPLLKLHPTTAPWGIVAFIAIPMKTYDGHVLGAFCAVDSKVRQWSDDDVQVMKELTASVMTEIHLQEQIATLEMERDLRDQFVTMLTHDLRTPLAIAKMASEVLSNEGIAVQERNKVTRMIGDNLDRADQMIRDLLDSSQMKAGEKVHLEVRPCNLNDLLQTTVEALKSLHGNRFILKSQDTLQGYWDARALRRMIENLAGNAVKYGDPEGFITLSLKRDGDFVELSVHNEGPTIDTISLQKLFEPFHRTESARKGQQKGWGLGLTLVRGFAVAHGGRVRVESKPGQGTTFTVRLPLDARSGQERPN